jgi:hypothetical protein
MRIRPLTLGIAVLALVSSARLSRAATLQLTTPLDGNANDSNLDGVWDTLTQGPSVSLLAYNGGSSYNYRGGMEFDIRALEQPLPATKYVLIESATLLVHYEGASGGPALTLQFSKFDGDGMLTLSDFQVRNPIGPRFNSFSPAADSLYRVPATEFIQSLVNRNVPYAGFFAENLAQNQTALGGYFSLVPPVLSITYSIAPEPSTLAAAGILASLASLHRRRRRPN